MQFFNVALRTKELTFVLSMQAVFQSIVSDFLNQLNDEWQHHI